MCVFLDPKVWIEYLKVYKITKNMSEQDKTSILYKADLIAKKNLCQHGSIIPYEIILESFFDPARDVLLTVPAAYWPDTMSMGMSKIVIKSYFIGFGINQIVNWILHEYSHGIYELQNFPSANITLELEALAKHSSRLRCSYTESKFACDLEKENFCDLFAYYLANNLPNGFDDKEKEEINELCTKIIEKSMLLHYKFNMRDNPLVVHQVN